MTRIVIIRHAEKPCDQGIIHGVNLHGRRDRHDLSVRGWQRAGALVRYFAPPGGHAADAAIACPRTIFAARATRGSPSLRSQHTVKPLAGLLGLHVCKHHAEGEEAALAAEALGADGPVLIAWHHCNIPRLVDAITGSDALCPRHWPDDRFDLVWTLDRNAGGWTFTQTAQTLLEGDHAHVI